jgi:peroxiredoxin
MLLVGVSGGLLSCQGGEQPVAVAVQSTPATPATAASQPLIVNSAALQKDFATWWAYMYDNVKLSQDFVGLDVDSTVITKAAFLAQLTSGRVVPFKVLVRDGVSYYRLYAVNEAQTGIVETIKQTAASEIDFFRMEGKALPAYKLTDIAGKTYSSSSNQGKLVVLKCWFIGCVACVKEFPEVNKLVDSYKDRNDIVFISLAIDKKENLVKFLQTHALQYATVPEMEDFMQGPLSVSAYPTHILLDRSGKIAKVVNRIDELKPFIDKQLAATAL